MIKQPLTVELALLGFVRHGPMYGYEIHQRLMSSEALGLVWNLKQSMLYALLARLEDEGYLTFSLEAQGNKPPRKILALTERGAAAFVAWLRSPVTHGRDFRLEFLAKLYFARQESREAALALVASQRKASAARHAELSEQAATLAASRSYDWLVLRFRLGQIAAILEWLDLCAAWAETAAAPELPPLPTFAE